MESSSCTHFQTGSYFPSSSSATLCGIKEKPINRPELAELKKKILDYLKIHEGKAYISELAETLNEEPRKIVFALRELKEANLIL